MTHRIFRYHWINHKFKDEACNSWRSPKQLKPFYGALLVAPTQTVHLLPFATLVAWNDGIGRNSRQFFRGSRWKRLAVFAFCQVSRFGSWRKSVIMNRIKRKLKQLYSITEVHAQESLTQNDLEECGLQGIHLREYQLDGVNWMKRCFECEHGCILGDEMGLGKTIQV